VRAVRPQNFTTSCSVILGTLISVFLFDFQLSLQFLWGSSLVVCSAYAYANAPPPEDLPKVPQYTSMKPSPENNEETDSGGSEMESRA